MTARVVVVGDIVTDVVAVVDGPITHASDTAAAITVTGGGAGGQYRGVAGVRGHGRDLVRCGR